MRLLDTQDRFGLVSIILHWLVALTVLSLLFIGFFELLHQPRGAERTFFANLHVSIAVVALPVILFRIFWRLKYGKPKAAPQHPLFMKAAALVWRTLLVLMLLQYFTGPAMVWIHEHPLDIFGIAHIAAPAPEFWALIYDSYGTVQFTHETVGWLLVGALMLHIGGALKHLLIDRDDVVKRIVVPAPDTPDGAEPDDGIATEKQHTSDSAMEQTLTR